MPVFLTHASQFFDPGVNEFYLALRGIIEEKFPERFGESSQAFYSSETNVIIPPERSRYLSEISETIRKYNRKAEEQSSIAAKIQALKETQKLTEGNLDKELNKHISEW